MRDLTIKIKLDKSLADAAAAAHVENLRKIKQAHESNAATQRKVDQEGLTSVRTTERAKQAVVAETAKQYTDAHGRMRDATGKFVATSRQMTQGLEESRVAGLGLAGSLSGIIGVAGGLGIVSQAGQAMSATMNAARQEADRLAERFIQQRDALREIAAISGGQANNKAVIQNAAFNTATGMRADESRGFVTEFLNAGNQNIGAGRSLSADEAAKFQVLAGQYATVKGVDPTLMGSLAGSTLGFQNFQGKGQGSNEALNSLNRAFAVMEAGQGNGSVMARQLQMLAASTVNEDSLKGVFKSPEEAGIAVSVGAEKHDASAAEMVKATARGIYATSGKEGDFLKAAGVGKDDDFFARIQKIADYAKSNGNDKGVRTSDFLADSFADHLTREGIETFVNRGVHGGVIAQRRGVLAGINAPDAGRKLFENAAADPDGAIKQRIIEAQNAEAEAKRAAGRTGLTQLGIEADTAITASGSRDSTAMGVFAGAFNTIGKPFQAAGLLPEFKELQRRRTMGEILDRKRNAAGLPALGGFNAMDPRTAIGYGGTVTGIGEDQALIKSLAELNATLEAQKKIAEEQLRVMKQNAPPVVPNVLARPAPVMTR